MNTYNISKTKLITEGDVETKVILPLLTNEEPIGLGFHNHDIQSKRSLKKLLIDKGDKAQRYYPDFVVSINGLPLIVVEAKKPEENLEEAFRQASLYAAELNRAFPIDENPCQLIIAINGLNLIAGSWETAKPLFNIPIDSWLVTDRDFSLFTSTFCKTELVPKSENVRKALRTEVMYKNPLYLLGGKYVQDQTVSNEFGETISINYQHLFNPNEESEREDIVKNAYVKVTKHQSHVDPIDKLIRKKIRPAVQESKEIFDNTKPKELIEKLESAQRFNNQVILLIGSVGSGKSTFSTYLKEVALDDDVNKKLSWVRLNLNDAPVSADEIYTWLKNNIIDQLKGQYRDIDYDELRFIEKLYFRNILALKKGVLQLLKEGSKKYNSLLADKILEFQGDLDLTLESYVHELVYARGKNLIVILDNCDKRNLEEQLLMFEVANWVKDHIKAIVFLPLRDTTFDHFRNEKPLDTVIKDLIFRIDPPSLEKVIYERIKYANRISSTNTSLNYYHLPNGWRVQNPSRDELYYLKSILSSLFQNRFFKKLITGLAGRDVRKGIEIFLDFCKSGHISEKDIFKMKQTKGEYILPNHIISRVFMRGNRIYYSDSESRIKNLFHSDPSDNLPDPFIRIAILEWLHTHRRKPGPSGILGFHRAGDLLQSMSKNGHEFNRVKKELLFLLQNFMIISESQETTRIEMEDLVSINPPGVIHFDLLNYVDYLATVAENVWYNSASIAEKIQKNIGGSGDYSHLSIENSIAHAEFLLKYMNEYFNHNFGFHGSFLADDSFNNPIDFNKTNSSIESFKKKMLGSSHSELAVGSIHKGRIVNIQEYGIFCEIIGTEKSGLIHVSSGLRDNFDELYDLGNIVDIEIIVYKADHNKYNLRLLEN